MDSNSVLAQQQPVSRQPSRRSNLLRLLLLLSLSFNVYFVWERVGIPPLADAAVASSAPRTVAQSAKPAAPPADPAPVAVAVNAKSDVFDKYQARQASYFAPEKPPGRELKTLHFKIRHSLNKSVCDLLPDPDCKLLSAYMGRLLMWWLDIDSQLRRGDTVSVVYEHLETEQDLRILHLAYDSGYRKERLTAQYYQPEGARHADYYDEHGREVALRLKEDRAPIRDYSEITSLPGDFRAGTWSGHSGTDFKAETGTPVYAPFEARVTRVNWNRHANGLCLELDHPRQGVKTLYLHLNRVLVKPGEYVQRGQAIAESGNTGRSFAPHLHYEMRSRAHKNQILNPFQFKGHATYRRTVNDLSEYRKTVKQFASILQNSLS